MVMIVWPEKSARNYHYSKHNKAGERSSRLLRGGRLVIAQLALSRLLRLFSGNVRLYGGYEGYPVVYMRDFFIKKVPHVVFILVIYAWLEFY
jgi:hypothetical protein